MEIWLEDKESGLSCGVNDAGDLFLGNDRGGYNLPDTPNNRDAVKADFYYYIKK